MNQKHIYANTTEEILNGFFEKAFLKPWTIPNPYFKSGKELCDCLVIIGNNVILISDKDSEYKNQPLEGGNENDVNIKWKRWYNKSVVDSARQLIGAKRKIQNQLQLFFDGSAREPIHLNIPENANIHLIAVSSDDKKTF